MNERLPIYPVETFPDRPAIIVPSIGEAYDIEDVSRAIADHGYIVRQDLNPEVSDRPGAEGWYVFVEAPEERLDYTLGGRKKKAKVKEKKPARGKAVAKKARSSAPPRRRKKGEGTPGIKKFGAQGFNLKKMPLGVMTQLLFQTIWPDAYSVSQDYPRLKRDKYDPPWFDQMDFNPHLYVNVEDVMARSRDGQEDPSWAEMAIDCADTGEPPHVGLYLFAEENHGSGKRLERQIMEIFDFPEEAMRQLERLEAHPEDDDLYQGLWEEYLSPYFHHLAYVLDVMKPTDLTGYFHFGTPSQSDEWGLMYEECREDTSDYGPVGSGEGDDDDEDDAEPDQPEGGDLNEP